MNNIFSRHFVLHAFASCTMAFMLACGSGPNGNATLCSTPADCTDPAQAYCVAGVCHACESPTNCTATAPVCEAEVFECGACVNDSSCGGYPTTSHCAPTGACVGCVTSDQCSGNTPVCDVAPGVCKACVTDGECATGACNLETGACIAEAAILYAAPTGTPNTMCTRAMPCTLKQALARVDSGKSTVVLADGNYVATAAASANLGGSKSALVVGSRLARLVGAVTDFEPTLTVSEGAFLRIRGMTLAGAEHAPVSCSTAFIAVDDVVASSSGSAQSIYLFGCKSTISRSSFNGYGIRSIYFHSNMVSSLKIDRCVFRQTMFTSASPLMLEVYEASATITNSQFINQISLCTICKIVQIIEPANSFSSRTFAFNTLIDGQLETAGSATKIHANIFASPTQTLTDSTSDYQNNLFNFATNPTVSGTGNFTGDPMFVDAAAGDFHLKAGSPAIDRGPATVPAGVPATDFDGRPRPVGAATDIGAFEYTP